MQFKSIRTPIKHLYKEFGVLKLRDLYNYNICCTVHKFVHKPTLLPEAITDIFRKNEQIHHYNTRHKKDLHPPKIKTKTYGERTFTFQGTTLWNNLPENIKEITSVNSFKAKLKQHTLDNYK